MTSTNLLWPLLLVTQALGRHEIIKDPTINVTTTVEDYNQTIKETTLEDFNQTIKDITLEDHNQTIKDITLEDHNQTTKESCDCEAYRLRICVLEIANDKIDLALKSCKELQDNDNYDTLQEIINQTVTQDIKSLPKLLKYINKLPLCNQHYAGFEFLFQALQSNQQWNTQGSFQFAYQLKKFIDEPQNCLHVNDDPELKEKLISLKYRIPDGIREIIWQKNKLCLKNTLHDEHLYSATCCHYDGDRRRAFTWIPQDEIGPHSEFTFEPIKDASLFRIKSDYFQEYLYAAECCKYDGKRRNVFTWIPKEDIGTQGDWTLELVNGTNVFRIRNDHYDEYLYAADCCYYDKERRSIFTWMSKGDIGVQGEWQISSCDSVPL